MQVINFNEYIDAIYCDVFPLRINYLSLKRLSKPWLTNALIKSIKTKSDVFKKLKCRIIDVETYRLFRNRLANLIRYSK